MGSSRRPPFGHIFGYTALTVMLTAGAAQSLSGSNTVFTDDIVDNAVTAADLGTNSVSRPKIQDNAIGAAEVLNNSLTGADISESTLALPCPPGTTRGGSFCYTALLEPQILATARIDCLTLGLRLPGSAAEAGLVAQVAGDGDGVYSWADDYTTTDIAQIAAKDGFGEGPDDNPAQYHCITTVGTSS